MKIPRKQRSKMGRQAVDIQECGWYTAPSGNRVEIDEQVKSAVEKTVIYSPDVGTPGNIVKNKYKTEISITNESTLFASNYLRKYGSVAALNFASATSPGGGFLTGAGAQEETLAWSSGLYWCLKDLEMYDFHKKRNDPLQTDYVIYSPDVPVFRLLPVYEGDPDELLEKTFPCSFVTAAAPMAKSLRRRGVAKEEILAVFEKRIHRVLAIFAHHGYRNIVLGAWGCGAYGNDGNEVARFFRQELEGSFAGVFERVVFAILDWSEERKFIGPFESALSTL